MTRTAHGETESITLINPRDLCRRVRDLAMREPNVDPVFRTLMFEQLHDIEVEVDRLSFRAVLDLTDTTAAELETCERRLDELEFRWSLTEAPAVAA